MMPVGVGSLADGLCGWVPLFAGGCGNKGGLRCEGSHGPAGCCLQAMGYAANAIGPQVKLAMVIDFWVGEVEPVAD